MELSDKGCDVRCVAAAQDAMLQLDVWAPDLIIVEYNLPGISGEELCRRVRMNINGRGIPIIMLTANEDENIEIRGLDSGADGFFGKSADTESLVLRVRAMLDTFDKGRTRGSSEQCDLQGAPHPSHRRQ